MTDRYDLKEITDAGEVPSNTDIIIEIKNGEINLISSGTPKKFLIINEDEKKMILKNYKDCFMSFQSLIKDRITLWKKKSLNK